jgi:hypothetical protein
VEVHWEALGRESSNRSNLANALKFLNAVVKSAAAAVVEVAVEMMMTWDSEAVQKIPKAEQAHLPRHLLQE